MIIVLNEFTVWRAAWRVARHRPVQILWIDPLLPPLRPLIERAAARLVHSGAGWLIDSVPEERDNWTIPNRIFVLDPMTRAEPWQERAYHFEAADQDPRDGRAVKLLATMFAAQRYVPAHLLARVRADGAAPPLGLSPTLDGLARIWGGEDSPPLPAGSIAGRLLNAVWSLAGAAAAAAFVLGRLRCAAPPHRAFLMADYNHDPRDFHLYNALAEGGEITVLMRNRQIQDSADPKALALRHFLPGQGRFGWRDGLAGLGEAFAESLALYRRYGRLEPALFFQVALLPYRRMAIRALFNLCRPRFFWSRDDYNVEHIVRRQELHRVGGRQFGLNHAVQGIVILLPHMRHVSMDVYYTMGAAFHPYFRDRWAADMNVRAVGSFAFSHEYFARPRRTSRAILFMTRFGMGEPEIVRTIRATAQAFPDRPIWVQVKRQPWAEATRADFIAACCAGLPNVTERSDPVYDLLLEPELIVSDPSTIIAEIVQLKIPVVVLDMLPEQKASIFRGFPDLCVTSAEACIDRLRALADGTARFEPDLYRDLINLEERTLGDVVREDMGLDQPRP